MKEVLLTGLREAWGLFVDDSALAIGVLLAVGIAASLAGVLSGDALGWTLFALVIVVMIVSLRRGARPG